MSQVTPTELASPDSKTEASSDRFAKTPIRDPAATAAVFKTTDPKQLFSENVVYIPSPEQNRLEFEIPAMPDSNLPPAVDDPFEVPALPPLTTVPPTDAPSCADGQIHDFKVPDDADQRLSFCRIMHEPYSVYRTEQGTLAWLPAHGQHFGWIDWQTDPYLKRGTKHGVTGAMNVHWLSGPGSSPLPPRLYEFVLGFQTRNNISDQFSYDLYTSIGAWSDFEDSARDGIRFPSHAVGMFHVNHSTDFVFGVDYLDRDDIAVLPVIGVSLRDVFVENLRMDLVFPRPRIDYMLTDTDRMYLAGTLNGGTWEIDFPDESNQVMTYRDFRLLLGFETASKNGSLSAWEFGWVFGRKLQFRDVPGATNFDDAFVIQWVTRH